MIRAYIVVVFAIMAVSCWAGTTCPPSDPAQPVDVVLTKRVDLTFDGRPETIELAIKAKDFRSAFTWKLSIYSEGTLLLERTIDDAWLNEFYGEKDYMVGCDGWVSCKCQYYWHDILDRLVLYKSYKPEEMSSVEPGYVLCAARDCLQARYGLEGKAAEKVIAAMARRFASRKIATLHIPRSPVVDYPPEVYVPEVNGFVIYYID